MPSMGLDTFEAENTDPSPYVTAGRERGPEGAPRDHINCVLEDCLCDKYPCLRAAARAASVPHAL